MRLSLSLLILCLVAIAWSACTNPIPEPRPTPEPAPDLDATIASQIQKQLATIPTATLYPTYTPNPTFTPYPTLTQAPTGTPYPTYTPPPTLEPLPTYTLPSTTTPYPTATPLPPTATPVPPTATPRPTATATPRPPPTIKPSPTLPQEIPLSKSDPTAFEESRKEIGDAFSFYMTLSKMCSDPQYNGHRPYSDMVALSKSIRLGKQVSEVLEKGGHTDDMTASDFEYAIDKLTDIGMQLVDICLPPD